MVTRSKRKRIDSIDDNKSFEKENIFFNNKKNKK